MNALRILAIILAITAVTGLGLAEGLLDKKPQLVPNDGKDDTVALRAALAAAKNQPGTTLFLPLGQYDFFLPENKQGKHEAAIAAIRDLNNFQLLARGARFVAHSSSTFFRFFAGSNIRIDGVEFDWAPLPRASMRVIAITATDATLQLVSPGVSIVKWTPEVGQGVGLNPEEVQHVEETSFVQRRV